MCHLLMGENMMKIVTIVGLVLLTLIGQAQADTIVPGPEIETQTWTASGSPYVITGDVSVFGVLTIESGVVVKFVDEVRLGGTLVVDGTAGAPVLMTSASDSPCPGIYGIVSAHSSDGVGRLSHLVVEYASRLGVSDQVQVDHTTVQYCASPLAALVVGSGDPGVLDSVVVRFNQGDGIYIAEWAAADLNNCDIHDNTGVGLRDHPLMGGSPTCVVTNSRIHHNGSVGVMAVQSVFDSEIHNNGGHGILWGIDHPISSVPREIRHCSIYENGGSGIHVETFVGSGPAVIEACNILNNQAYALDLSYSHFYDTIDAGGNYWGATSMEDIMALINIEPALSGVDVANLIIDSFETTVGSESVSWGDLKAGYR